jgi:transposase
MRKGTVSLRRCLSQAAWAISRMKNTYLSALYRRIAARRGAKRAVLAVAHALLFIAFHMLKSKENYRELGADHFDRIDVNRIRRSLVRRLERLGHGVTYHSPRPPERDFRRSKAGWVFASRKGS